jgi:zinc transport system substrate-binding protein
LTHRRRLWRRALIILAASLLLLVASGRASEWLSRVSALRGEGSGTPAATAGGPLRVACSLHVVADLVSQVGGQRVQAHAVLPAGADPHTFELRPSQVAAFAGADLALAVGSGLDPFMERLASAAPAPGLPVYRLTELIDQEVLIGPHGDSPYDAKDCHASHGSRTGASPAHAHPVDPHIWLDPTLIRDHVLSAILDVLIAADPEGESHYIDRANAYAAQLTELDEWIDAAIAPVRQKALISVHPTWAYFSRRYGLQVWAMQPGHGGEVSPRHVAALLGVASERNVTTLFREAQASDAGLAGMLRTVGGQVKVLDPLGGPDAEGYESYLPLMRRNVSAIVAGLSRGW